MKTPALIHEPRCHCGAKAIVTIREKVPSGVATLHFCAKHFFEHRGKKQEEADFNALLDSFLKSTDL